MKAQMKVADRSGATLAVIVGTEELEAGEVAVRDLRADSGQETIAVENLLDVLREKLR
jgi:histidyl-tRNA synthetase